MSSVTNTLCLGAFKEWGFPGMLAQPSNILRAIVLAVLIAVAAWTLLDFLFGILSPELRTLVWSVANRLRR